ncbi:uncharacterized protein SAPINGB_P000935 [Magnusiomyces paraingens]|uniref:Signal recognition particle subunit SRP68 n=1 Tax=Magnusiomyces paraingens TaxID=2606893 RepID=A0A5E8B332_9ASCO|nr:uncharacterized protein SAPINGB_P000935 [Saprochaete ingens]VVT45876.1 unnamed protein product [Saprochaete ingens]
MSYNVLVEVLTERNELPLQSANDYRQYRVRSTKKLARTRKILGVQKRSSKGGASNSSTEPRHRIPFKEPALDDVQNNPELIKVLVCLAERSWAHAMETRSVLDTNFSSTKKSHVRTKLTKACKYIDAAVSLVREITKTDKLSGFGTFQILQLEAYASLIHGALFFQTKNYEKCIKNYSLARISLEAISGFDSSTSIIKDDIDEIISTVIDPSIIFAQYRLTKIRPLSASGVSIKTVQKMTDHPAVKIISQINPSLLDSSLSEGSAGSRLENIIWRKYDVSIQDRELAAFLYKTVTKDNSLEVELKGAQNNKSIEKSLELFDEILQSWQDSREMVKTNIDRLESSGGSSNDQEIQDQYVISTYIGYHMLLRRIQRDVLLLKRVDSRIFASLNNDTKKGNKISTKGFEKMNEIVRLYDTILQSTRELTDLPGIHTDKKLSDSLQSLDIFYKAERLNLLAKAYRLSSHYPESLALYGKSLELLLSAPQEISVEFPFGILDQSKFHKVLTDTNLTTLQLRAQLTIRGNINVKDPNFMEIDGPEVNAKAAVIDNLEQYGISNFGSEKAVAENLVSFDTSLEPVFSKPVFFDVAYNFISQFDYARIGSSESVSDSSIQDSDSSGVPEEKKKSGGFLRGLLGR